jgi:molecular chaperone GrpE (heat shock protein)
MTMLGLLSEKEFRTAMAERELALAGRFEELGERLQKSERSGRRGLAALETLVERQEAALAMLGRLQAESPPVKAVMAFAEGFAQWSASAQPSPEISMLGRKLDALLAAFGLELYGRPGDCFDPALHEACDTRYAPDFAENALLEVVKPGFRSNGVVISYASVVVNRPETEPKND